METASRRGRVSAIVNRRIEKTSVTDECGIESRQCVEYLRRASSEQQFSENVTTKKRVGLIVTQGFEERSLGILEGLAANGTEICTVVINRYLEPSRGPINTKYQERFQSASEIAAPHRWYTVENDYGGTWVRQAINLIDADEIILDITAISNRGMFCALDAAAASQRKVLLAYSEPKEYWPKRSDWDLLNKELLGQQSVADVVDAKPWLFGYAHRVELIPGHEGYDSAGTGRALIGFLPFKCARLAAVLGEEDYEECLFIAGRPRLRENQWRLGALKKINENLIKEWPVKAMHTFGYLKTLRQLSSLLFQQDSMLARYNVHFAIMGSKLQTIGCWILSSLIPSITMVISVPSRYYPEAFSAGIGAKWIFPLSVPTKQISGFD